MFIFEPVERFYNILVSKYRNNDKIKVIKAGLSGKNSLEEIVVQGERSSVFLDVKEPKERVVMLDIFDFWRENIGDTRVVDLISINIEGGEYDLINRIIQTNLIDKINILQVQFHKLYPNHIAERAKIIHTLSRTHEVSYSFPYVWECFRKKT
ncbi:MAG: FkbM family methyltransferase [candidate division WOR-3 bacterium]